VGLGAAPVGLPGPMSFCSSSNNSLALGKKETSSLSGHENARSYLNVSGLRKVHKVKLVPVYDDTRERRYMFCLTI
jgi:hypothetical protein